MAKYEKGKVIQGTVSGIESYGVFVSLDGYYSGLIHISEISFNFVKNINDYVKVGDNINVEIIGIDEKNHHLNLSIKNIKYQRKVLKKKRIIEETSLGFKTLANKLPYWINESIQKYEKATK